VERCSRGISHTEASEEASTSYQGQPRIMSTDVTRPVCNGCQPRT
jgi:hypothetical protein